MDVVFSLHSCSSPVSDSVYCRCALMTLFQGLPFRYAADKNRQGSSSWLPGRFIFLLCVCHLGCHQQAAVVGSVGDGQFLSCRDAAAL